MKPARKVARALMPNGHMHTKAEADYGPGSKAEHCAICEHFDAPDACEIVKGPIAPNMWCRYFLED